MRSNCLKLSQSSQYGILAKLWMVSSLMSAVDTARLLAKSKKTAKNKQRYVEP